MLVSAIEGEALNGPVEAQWGKMIKIAEENVSKPFLARVEVGCEG